MKTSADFIENKVRTAGVVLSEDQTRRLRASFKAAGLQQITSEADERIAATLVQRAMQHVSVSIHSCPRCKTAMIPCKLATRTEANVCPQCRVVTPV